MSRCRGDGKTVAWDTSKKVSRPERHDYLEGEGRWHDPQFEDDT